MAPKLNVGKRLGAALRGHFTRLAPGETLPLALVLAACSFTNDIDVCGVSGQEFRVNARGDNDEWLATPQAVAELRSGRLLVAWSVQSPSSEDELPATSIVNFGLIDSGTGRRVEPCGELTPERTLSDPELFVVGPTAAPADVDIAGAQPTQAIVGWVEWQDRSTQNKRVRLRFLDSAGCDQGQEFSPVPATEIPNAQGLSLAWSAPERFVLAGFHDLASVYVSRIVDPGFGYTTEVARETLIGGTVASAVLPDGSALVGWLAFDDAGAVLDQRLSARVATLDASGELTGGPFDLNLPVDFLRAGTSPSITISGRIDRFTVTVDAASGTGEPLRTFAIDVNRQGRAMGAPRELSTNGGSNRRSFVASTPDGGALGVWYADEERGVVARLFSETWEPRFNAVTCDEQWLPVGLRTTQFSGWPQSLAVDDELWVFYGAPGDSYGSAVMAWHVPFSALWPGGR